MQSYLTTPYALNKKQTRQNNMNTVCKLFVPRLLLCLVALCLLSPAEIAKADSFTIDQSQNLFSFGYSLSDDVRINSAPLAQSFRPTANYLNAVALYLSDADSSRSNGSTVRIRLRSDSLTGSILATSNSFFVPNDFQLNPDAPIDGGLVRFDFLSDVLVVPDSTYVIEVVRESGDDVRVAAMGANPYSRGEVFVNGTPQAGGDLLFQTGIVTVPEPGDFILFASGMFLLFMFRFASHRTQQASTSK